MSEFLHHTMEIVTDPAHLAAEVLLMLVVDGLVLGLIAPFIGRAIAKRVHREHLAIDAEHGVEHDAADVGAPVDRLVGLSAEDLVRLRDAVLADFDRRLAGVLAGDRSDG